MWPIVQRSARAARQNGVKSDTDFASAAPSGSQAPPLLDYLLCNLAAGSGPGDLRGCSRYGPLCQVAAERHAVEMVSNQTSVGRAHGRELVKKYLLHRPDLLVTGRAEPASLVPDMTRYIIDAQWPRGSRGALLVVAETRGVTDVIACKPTGWRPCWRPCWRHVHWRHGDGVACRSVQ